LYHHVHHDPMFGDDLRVHVLKVVPTVAVLELPSLLLQWKKRKEMVLVLTSCRAEREWLDKQY
jgi:hypothetical protein